MPRGIQFEGRPVWAEISLSAIAHNLRLIRRKIGKKRKILAVVKANAYGLGAVEISKSLSRLGAEAFGGTCASEGIELREAGSRQPILLLTGFWPGEEKRVLHYNLLTPPVRMIGAIGTGDLAALASVGLCLLGE